MSTGCCEILVGGGTIVAVLSLVEWRTGMNIFNWLRSRAAVPALRRSGRGHAARHRRARARLGAAPDRARRGARDAAAADGLPPRSATSNKIWLVCAGILTLGSFSTGSRTAAIMLIVLLVVFFWLKRAETIKMIPTLLRADGRRPGRDARHAAAPSGRSSTPPTGQGAVVGRGRRRQRAHRRRRAEPARVVAGPRSSARASARASRRTKVGTERRADPRRPVARRRCWRSVRWACWR